MFYREYSDGKLKAENPVKHLMQFTTPEVGDVLLFPVSRAIDFIRVANVCDTTKSVSATSYDINGNANGSTNINLGAFKGGTINPASFNASSTIYSVKLSTSGACIAGWMWHVDTGGYMGITGQEDGDFPYPC